MLPEFNFLIRTRIRKDEQSRDDQAKKNPLRNKFFYLRSAYEKLWRKIW